MSNFWSNKSNIILVLFFIIVILCIWFGLDYNNLEKLSISITSLMVLVTALSTLYSNYKNDLRIQEQNEFHMEQLEKQLLFDKKQEVHLELYNELSKFWEFLDEEKNETLLNLHNLDFTQDLDAVTFVHILETVSSFKLSPKFYYLSPEIKSIIIEFLNFCDKKIDMNNMIIGKFDESTCLSALDILSKIFPLLKKEFGENL